MFCPECGAEFRVGYTQCNECGVTLAEEPPPPGPTCALRQLALVGRYLHPAEAAAVHCALRGAGLRTWLWNEHVVSVWWLVSPAIGGICVLVDAEDWDDAREWLSSADLPPLPAAEAYLPLRSTWRWRIAILWAWLNLIPYLLVVLVVASIIKADRRPAATPADQTGDDVSPS